MRFTTTIASSIASLIVLCDQVQGQGSTLLQQFAIGGPDYTYDNLQFTMNFEVSDFMQDNMIGYSLYDGKNCKDGGDNDITENDGYLLSRIRTDNTPIGDGSGIRSIRIQSEIVGTKIVNSGIYTANDDENTGVIEFCLRFGNYNADKDGPQAFEVNYVEVPITLTINFNSSFSVQAAVQPIDLVLSSVSQGVAVDAYICDRDDNLVPIMTTGQGQTIRVCVSPTAENIALGALMRQLEQFTFNRDLPIPRQQAAIEPGTGGAPADPFTLVSCRSGSMVCAFETLLQADFFTGPGIVRGQGQAFLQIGTDETVAARKLEGGTPNQILSESPTSYSIAIELVPVDSLGMDLLVSSAPSTTRTASAFMVTALLAIGLALSTTAGLI